MIIITAQSSARHSYYFGIGDVEGFSIPEYGENPARSGDEDSRLGVVESVNVELLNVDTIPVCAREAETRQAWSGSRESDRGRARW